MSFFNASLSVGIVKRHRDGGC
nr:hypothetical protein [Salmonella enterica]